MVKRRNLPVSILLVGLALVLLAGCDRTETRTDWPYPRYDLANTGANPTVKCRLLEEPTMLWEVTLPEGDIPWPLFPVAADIDDDGSLEYLLGGWNQNPEFWLYAYNIEDGSNLWKRYFEDQLHWSAPIVVDVNGDGKEDVVLATGAQVMALNGHDGSSIWEQPFPGVGMGMTVADVDDDGRVEVVINDYGEPKRIYLLNGQDGSTIWQRETGGSAYNIPTVGDVDGDNRLEILSHSHLYDPSGERLLAWDQEGNELWAYQASPSAEQEANAPPELGWVPDFGYIATTIADFNADGQLEIGWGTRCHYYLLNGQGDLLWRVPTVEGFGLYFTYQDDGTLEADTHGTGGPSGYAAGVGNLDDDPALEVVLSFGPEYRGGWDGTAWNYDRITPANEIRVLDGEDGSLQWVFQGEYLSEDKSDQMHEPLLVDLTGDGLLDVLALSTNTYLYAIQGNTGEQLLAYRLGPEDAPTSVDHDLTFVVDAEAGIVLYTTTVYRSTNETDWTFDSILHALQISSGCR
jgi:outer membrane protein assembly factor BamB